MAVTFLWRPYLAIMSTEYPWLRVFLKLLAICVQKYSFWITVFEIVYMLRMSIFLFFKCSAACLEFGVMCSGPFHLSNTWCTWRETSKTNEQQYSTGGTIWPWVWLFICGLVILCWSFCVHLFCSLRLEVQCWTNREFIVKVVCWTRVRLRLELDWCGWIVKYLFNGRIW